MSLAEVLAQAVELHRAGRLAEAEHLYRQILLTEPEQPNAWHLLGVIAHQQADHEAALAMIGRAIASGSGDAAIPCNYACVLNVVGRHVEALPYFEQSLQLDPRLAKTWYNYANALRELSRADDAIIAYRRAIELQPQYAEALTNLGVLLRDQGEPEQAAECYRAALQIKPELSTALFNLGNVLADLNQDSPALAGVSNEQRIAEVLSLYDAAIRAQPNYYQAYANLGTLLKSLGRLDDAVAAYQTALRIQPDFIEALSNLALAYQDLGQVDEALRWVDYALRLKPDYAEIDSNRLFLLNYDPAQSNATLLAEHRRWAERHTLELNVVDRLRVVVRPSPRASKRLRIGYLSPDLRTHPVGQFIAPVFEHYDREQFETFVYSDVLQPDCLTDRLRSQATAWRHLAKKKSSAVAELIRADEIDIAVDLAGHTSHHRLLALAERPAPVQITYLGYPNTTGLDAFDYLITDAIVDPPGSEVPESEAWYSERLLRLETCFSCYQPRVNAPQVAPLPALRVGKIAFGALHNLAKLNAGVLDLWGELLHDLPESRLLVFRNVLHGSVATRLAAEFTRRGVESGRVDLQHVVPSEGGHLAIYDRIDISLDTFPWSGHTTACESLWMGVPVVTLRGERHAGRMVASVLHALGHDAWIAETPEQYREIVRAAAGDLDRLATLRRGLRDTLRTSPQCDGAAFTRQLEAAYRQAWQTSVMNAI